MAREETDIAGRRRKGGRAAPAGGRSPRDPRKPLASPHPLPEDQALLLHLLSRRNSPVSLPTTGKLVDAIIAGVPAEQGRTG